MSANTAKATRTEKPSQQQVYRDHLDYAKENPQWTLAAIQVIKAWERNEKTLVHAVAVGLKDIYEKGQAGEELPREFHDSSVIRRRTHPAHEPSSEPPSEPPTVIRRRR